MIYFSRIVIIKYYIQEDQYNHLGMDMLEFVLLGSRDFGA